MEQTPPDKRARLDNENESSEVTVLAKLILVLASCTLSRFFVCSVVTVRAFIEVVTTVVNLGVHRTNNR